MTKRRNGFCCILLMLLALGLVTQALADSLRGTIQYTLATNPDVLISMQQRLQAHERYKQSRAGYFPTLDTYANGGHERSKNFSTQQQWVALPRWDASVELRQNMFNGLETFYTVKADLARLSAASHNVNDTAQNTALAVAEVYLNVLRTKELISIAKNNVLIHRDTFRIIAKRAEKGLGRYSEQEQTEGRLALAQSDLYSEINSHQSAIAEYVAIVGKQPRHLQHPTQKLPYMGFSRPRAIAFALSRNPGLKQARYEFYAAFNAHKASYSTFFPSITAVATIKRGANQGGIEGDNFNNTYLLQANWNILRGGADIAKQREEAYKRNQALEEVRNRERQLISDTRIAWNTLYTLMKRLPKLRTHMVKTQLVIKAYREQYVAGKRTLLDVLNAEREFFSSSKAYTEAKYDIIFAKYRLLNQMGVLLQTFSLPLPESIGNSKETHTAYTKQTILPAHQPIPEYKKRPRKEVDPNVFTKPNSKEKIENLEIPRKTEELTSPQKITPPKNNKKTKELNIPRPTGFLATLKKLLTPKRTATPQKSNSPQHIEKTRVLNIPKPTGFLATLEKLITPKKTATHTTPQKTKISQHIKKTEVLNIPQPTGFMETLETLTTPKKTTTFTPQHKAKRLATLHKPQLTRKTKSLATPQKTQKLATLHKPQLTRKTKPLATPQKTQKLATLHKPQVTRKTKSLATPQKTRGLAVLQHPRKTHPHKTAHYS